MVSSLLIERPEKSQNLGSIPIALQKLCRKNQAPGTKYPPPPPPPPGANRVKGFVENVEKYTLAAIAVQNYLRMTNNTMYTPAGLVDSEAKDTKYVDGAWRKIVSEDGGNGGFREI